MSKASFELFRGELIGAGLYKTLDALSLAEKAHEGVMRKDKVTPYIEHPMKVASLLFDAGIRDENVLVTAILHDVVEDTEISLLDISTKFGDEIATSVKKLSKPSNYSNDNYYAGIQSDPVAVLVKLADRTHNLSTFSVFSKEKKAEYIKETEEFVYPLIKFAQHTYYKYASQIRLFDLWIETVVNTVSPFLKDIETNKG